MSKYIFWNELQFKMEHLNINLLLVIKNKINMETNSNTVLNLKSTIKVCIHCGVTQLEGQDKCSNCGEILNIECNCCNKIIRQNIFNYCPNCGVKIVILIK
jgi:rRNA maturation protein Nop10